MATKFLVPRLGEGVDEVTIVKWLKNEGEPVKELEPLVEVETDKVVTEVPSPASGVVLKIEIGENTPVRVGEVMAWIGETGESVHVSSVPVPNETVAGGAEIHNTGTRDTGTRDTGFLSPIVRKMAAEHGVDLSQVRGTGLGGRITKQDVLDYVEGRKLQVESRKLQVESRKPQAEGREDVSPAAATPDTRTRDTVTHDTETRDTVTHDTETLLPHTPIRRQIAERMVASKRISPHVLTVMEADMSRVLAHRAAHKAEFARQGVNLTFTAYFVAAIAAALRANPLVNSTWTDEGLLLHGEINIGVAVALGEEGLIVPVIRNADHLSLLGIARAVNDLAERARTKRLQPDEVKGATFTLTNHGTAGSLFAMPIISQPQCGILGTGTIQKRPVVVSDAEGNDAIAIRPMVYLSFVFDHRILDGASADAFLGKVGEALEGWHEHPV
ncbi:MAG: dihydrolipoamide acetyltransferase family protein [Anaerolineales bacterium]